MKKASFLVKKMTDCSQMKRAEHLKKFQTFVGDLIKVAMKPGTATLADYVEKGQGDLAEGIRTSMRLGDLEIFIEDAPDEVAVEEDYEHSYAGNEMAPLAKLLPTLTVTGTEKTDWRVETAVEIG